MLDKASYSAENLARQLKAKVAAGSLKGDDLKTYVKHELVEKGLGIWDATKDELQLLVDNANSASYSFADMVSRRAQIGWTTHGHSAVDVNIYGTAGSSDLRGNHENIEIGQFLRNYLDVDVKAITEELKKANVFSAADSGGTGWTGRVPSEEEIQSVLRYHAESYNDFY